MYCGEKTMDWKTANREIALHNLNCEDGSYIEVYGIEKNGGMKRIVPNRFFKEGSVVDAYFTFYHSWKSIEPPTEDDILKQAKDICFKIGYVRNKDWKNGWFVSVMGYDGEKFHVFDFLRGSIKELTAKHIVEHWESVDPRA